MLKEIQGLICYLEDRKSRLISDLSTYSEGQLRIQPENGRWSILMALEHIVLGERGIRLTEAELRGNPVRKQLRTGKMLAVVMDVLETDIPVDVPDISVQPDGSMNLNELLALWGRERKALCDLLEKVTEKTVNDVMFSHPAAGPLDPVNTLKLAVAHFDTHRRQIDKLRSEIQKKTG
ncbi:MAG: DinB family protein [Desulfobacterales bacterium]|jgi:hypothetical protein